MLHRQPAKIAFPHQVLFLYVGIAPCYVCLYRLEIPKPDYNYVIFPEPNPLPHLSGNPALPFLAVIARYLDLVRAVHLYDKAEHLKLLLIREARLPYFLKLFLFLHFNFFFLAQPYTYILYICACGTPPIIIMLLCLIKPSLTATATDLF